MKFHKKRLKFVIPLTVIVTVASTFMLFNRYPEVASKDKFLIWVDEHTKGGKK